MPEVKDETGKVIANMPYDAAGKLAAKEMAAENPGWNVTDARDRSGINHAGDGTTGYNSIGVPMYKEGGETKEDKGIFGVEGGVFSEAGKKRRAERKKARQERRAARKAARQAKIAKRVSEGKNLIPRVKKNFVYKEGEHSTEEKPYDIAYKKKGTKSQQQVKVVTEKGAKPLSVETKGGDFQVYGKGTKESKSYQEAYAKAKKSGGQGAKFTWGGNEHVVRDAKPAKKKSKAEKKAQRGHVY